MDARPILRCTVALFTFVHTKCLMTSWNVKARHRSWASRARTSILDFGGRTSTGSVAPKGRKPCRHRGATGVAGTEATETILHDLLDCFQGEFDNYDQVVADRGAGLSAGPGGGHEHIHCSLRCLDRAQVPSQILEGETTDASREHEAPLAMVSAKYYFNGDANVVFRYRLYSFHGRPSDSEDARGDLVMRLWRLAPSVERRLRQRGYNLEDFAWHECEDGGVQPPSVPDPVAECMVGCDIFWSRGTISAPVEAHEEGDAGCPGSNAKEAVLAEERQAFVGLMGTDDSGTWISSQNTHGLDILVKDDLKLWPDHLWVNDRGYDREGNFVYGNQRGVPYKMSRVVVPGPLEWTLGEASRTKVLYAEKMAAIGVKPGQRFGPVGVVAPN